MLGQLAPRRTSRRRLLAGTATIAALTILQACGAAAPVATQTPAKLSEAPTVAPVQATTAPASTATAASGQPTTAPAVTAAAGAKKDFTIHLWTHDFIIRDFFKDRAKEWVPQQTGWNLNYDFQAVASEAGGGDVFTKFLTAVAANQSVPEIMLIQIESFTKFQKQDIALTALTDLTPLINEAGGFPNFIKLGDYSWKGKYFCIDTVAGAMVYHYREDLFQEAGVKLPITTFDDMITEGSKLQAKGRFIDSSELLGWEKYNRLLEMRNHNGVFDSNGTVLLDTPEAIETLQYMSDLIHKHKVMYLADTDTGQTAAYQGNKIAGSSHADWWAPFVMNTEYKGTVGKWRAQVIPQIVKGDSKTTSWGGVGASIYQKAPNPDLVKDFYRYALLKPENHAKLMLDYGYWPSMRSSWKVPGMAEWKSKLLGDQVFGEIELKSSDAMVDMNYGAFWGEAKVITDKAVYSVIVNRTDPAQTLRAAAKDLRDVVTKG